MGEVDEVNVKGVDAKYGGLALKGSPQQKIVDCVGQNTEPEYPKLPLGISFGYTFRFVRPKVPKVP